MSSSPQGRSSRQAADKTQDLGACRLQRSLGTQAHETLYKVRVAGEPRTESKTTRDNDVLCFTMCATAGNLLTKSKHAMISCHAGAGSQQVRCSRLQHVVYDFLARSHHACEPMTSPGAELSKKTLNPKSYSFGWPRQLGWDLVAMRKLSRAPGLSCSQPA